MQKEFNTTGLCIPSKHYMVDTSKKINEVIQLIEKSKYFTLNRPRQFGKTTTSYLLFERLKKDSNYLVIELSFESTGKVLFNNEENISKGFAEMLIDKLEFLAEENLVNYTKAYLPQITDLKGLSKFITILTKKAERKVVLIIDEVDKSSNNTLFLQLLGLFRDKYLLYQRGNDFTFHSIILIGVHDIKNLKRKIRPEDKHSLNSPWNIAIDFNVDMSFYATEIQTMLIQYCQETGRNIDIPTTAERIYYYTSGYPYLVSAMCKVIDEIILPKREDKDWTMEDVEASFRYLVNSGYTTTLFDDLAKNIYNNQDLYKLIFDIVINGQSQKFIIKRPIISLASTYGILQEDEQGFCKVHNRIFEQIIYDMMLGDAEGSEDFKIISYDQFKNQEIIFLPKILRKFQEFMQENYTQKDIHFLERQGRLLFISFLRPILNGKGFDFKEPVVGEERRIDIVISYQQKRYVVELKIWRGEEYHQAGLQQLSDYLDLYQLKEGYLLIFDFRKEKKYKQKEIIFKGKKIFAVWV